ncbi:MAG: hypothetical protein NTW33_07545 [Methanoregula sp.]|nr:hypothetical protein [Methanoregula sp.]
MTDPAHQHGQLYAELNAAWAIAKKDIAIYYLKPNIIVSGALFPLFCHDPGAYRDHDPLLSIVH